MTSETQIQDLQQRVQRMQGAAVSRSLPSLPGLAQVMGMRTGAAYGVDSAGLALALLAGPSQAGEWVAVVGATDLGFEAAAGYGMDLDRTIVVPHPGEHWLTVTAGLIDVATVILVKPPVAVTEHQAERLKSRLRQKDATLVCWGSWPRCEARMVVRSSTWTGLGQGHGRLQGRRMVVDVIRGNAPRRSVGLWLPGGDQELRVDHSGPETAAQVGFDQVMAG
ncbi:MAG TPA: hypothetical protein VIT20_02715 [Propionibacteriaceae bacterium]